MTALGFTNFLYIWTDILKQAGTVDDTDKIVETMESSTFESLLGPMYYGGRAVNGVGHIGVWPVPIFEIVGESEYRLLTVYTPEESEALLNEVFRAR